MLYHIFEAFHPSPSTKGTLFSKIALSKNHNEKIGCPIIFGLVTNFRYTPLDLNIFLDLVTLICADSLT